MAETAKRDTFIGDCVFFSLAQQGVVGALAGAILDGGQILQCVAYAAVAEVGGNPGADNDRLEH